MKKLFFAEYRKLYLPLRDANVVRFYPLLEDYETAKKLVVRSVVDYADGRRLQVGISFGNKIQRNFIKSIDCQPTRTSARCGHKNEHWSIDSGADTRT